MKKHVKKTAVFLAAALLCEAIMPVSALEENVKKQLEAVKSLADLDLDSNAQPFRFCCSSAWIFCRMAIR